MPRPARPDTDKKIVSQAPEVRAITKTWKPLTDATGQSQAELAKHLPVSATAFSRMMSDQYAARLTPQKAMEIDGALHAYIGSLALNGAQGRGDTFLEFREFTALRKAINKARAAVAARDEHRIVWFTAPPGMGKDAAITWLKATAPMVRAVQALPSWRESYFSVVRKIAADLGISPDGKLSSGAPVRLNSARGCEEAIIEELNSNAWTICLNEVAYMSAKLLSLLKTLVNDTLAVVVVFCTPGYYRQIMKCPREGEAHSEEVKHIQRRSTWLNFSVVTPEHVARFAEHYGVGAESLPEPDGTARYDWPNVLCQAATRFGGFDLVGQAMRRLQSSPTMATLDKSIAIFNDPREAALR